MRSHGGDVHERIKKLEALILLVNGGGSALGLVVAPTFADLRLTPPSSGLTATLLSYATPNDGGWGTFFWDATSTAPDNGGTIAKVTGITVGRWIREWDGPYNVVHFGADDTGVADSTAAFAACFAASTGEVFIPDGGFQISQLSITKPVKITLGITTITGNAPNALILVNHNTQIWGNSKFETFLVPASGQTAIFFSGTWPDPEDLFSQVFYMRDLCVSGGLHAIDTSGLTPGTFFSQGSFAIEHCRFFNMSDRALIISSAISYTEYNNCGFTGCNGSSLIGDNTETKCFYNIHNPAPGSSNPSVEVNSGHRVHIDTDVFEGAANRSAPDILIYCNNNFNQAAGIVKVLNCNFAPEREFAWNSARNRIQCFFAATPSNAAGPVEIRGNYFYVGSPAIMPCNIAVVGGVATATVTLSGGQTDCGIQVNDTFSIVQSTDSSLCGGPFTCTARTPLSISWATSGANRVSAGGFVEPGSVAAIALKSPGVMWNIDGNTFLGYPICVDDNHGTNYIDGQARNGINKHVFGPNNRVIGQIGRNVQTFSNGGFGFDRAELAPSVPDIPLSPAPRITETVQLLNRCFFSEQAQGVTNCTQTPGQTDPFGGTRAFILARHGVAQMFTNGTGPTEAAAIEIDVGTSFPLPTNPPVSYLTFWAKKGGANPSDLLTFFLFQDAVLPANTVCWQVTATLGPNWKRYCFPLVWIPALVGSTVNDIFFVPGAEDLEVSSAVIFGVQISDSETDDYLATTGAATQDTATGMKLQKALDISTSGLSNLAAHTAAPPAGGGDPLPVTPAGYVTLVIDGITRQIAVY